MIFSGFAGRPVNHRAHKNSNIKNMRIKSWATIAGAVSLSVLLSACDSSGSSTETADVPESFRLGFTAKSGQSAITCDGQYDGLGPDGAYSVGVTDLRFYVSNVRFYDSANNEIALTFDDNDFQLGHTAGFVGLIDFLSTGSDFCDLAGEGTSRTNTGLVGQLDQAAVSDVASISFDIGVPQAVMKSVIAASDDVSDTPSPLGEMHWSWASGYRHFVLNFTAMNADNTTRVENSNFHIGSTDCGGGGQALADQDECGYLNTARVRLDDFDLSSDTVSVDLEAILANVGDEHFIAPVWSEIVDNDESACIDERRFNGYCVTGEDFGLQCHSGLSQGACGALFPNFGIGLEDGQSDSANNRVFGKN